MDLVGQASWKLQSSRMSLNKGTDIPALVQGRLDSTEGTRGGM
jgi:hypothetical protein